MSEQLPRKTLREWRDSKWLTQAELAEQVGVTYFTISNWEVGTKVPRAKNMRELARVLGVRPEQIIIKEGKGLPVAA